MRYYYLLTALANSVPTLNFATFLAAILIAFPVRGLIPLRAALLTTLKVPNPIRIRLPPFLRVLVVWLKELENLDLKLSNPNELIHYTCKLTANLSPTWSSGDYYQKQVFQNTLFPKGLVYDSKIEHYRTPIVNSVIGYVADLSRGLGGSKNGTPQNHPNKALSVPGVGIEPTFS